MSNDFLWGAAVVMAVGMVFFGLMLLWQRREYEKTLNTIRAVSLHEEKKREQLMRHYREATKALTNELERLSGRFVGGTMGGIVMYEDPNVPDNVIWGFSHEGDEDV